VNLLGEAKNSKCNTDLAPKKLKHMMNLASVYDHQYSDPLQQVSPLEMMIHFYFIEGID
jgi:hypothetical protein